MGSDLLLHANGTGLEDPSPGNSIREGGSSTRSSLNRAAIIAPGDGSNGGQFLRKGYLWKF
jgi:hypothetical protein